MVSKDQLGGGSDFDRRSVFTNLIVSRVTEAWKPRDVENYVVTHRDRMENEAELRGKLPVYDENAKLWEAVMEKRSELSLEAQCVVDVGFLHAQSGLGALAVTGDSAHRSIMLWMANALCRERLKDNPQEPFPGFVNLLVQTMPVNELKKRGWMDKDDGKIVKTDTEILNDVLPKCVWRAKPPAGPMKFIGGVHHPVSGVIGRFRNLTRNNYMRTRLFSLFGPGCRDVFACVSHHHEAHRRALPAH